MDLALILIILFGFFLYLLDRKVKLIEEKTGENSVVRLQFIPKHDLYDLPYIKELARLDKSEINLLYKDLKNKSQKEVGATIRSIGNKMYPHFILFYDKKLFFSGRDGNFGFGDLYGDELYREVLGKTKDGKTVEFIIKSRAETKLIPNATMPVLRGYLKKYNEDRRFGEKNDDEIVILFDLPRFLIDPLPSSTRILGKDRWQILREREQLLIKFGFEVKEDDDDLGCFINDFGEQDYRMGRGKWYENKYFEVKI